MANLNILNKKIQELLNIVLKAGNDLDASNVGVSNYFPDGKSADMTRMCLNLFNIYIAMSDNILDEKEIELINSIAGTTFGKAEIETIISRTELGKASFAEQVPVIFRAFVDADNYEDKSVGGCPLSVILYDLFATSGVYMMAVNEQIECEEYNRLMAYLNIIFKFIKQNLKYGYNDIKKPEDMVSNILNQAEIEFNKQKSSKNEASNDETDAKNDEKEEQTLEELINELNSMIGLDEVKYEVTSLMNLLRVKILREQMGLKMPPVSMHLVFSGNPGTGKTSVARLLAKIYKKIGVLNKGHLIEVDRSGLVGGYVGQTAIKVSDVINSAIGGILFIDEAYSLTPENMINDYGSEAIDTLVKAMEDHRKDLIVIVAGYPDLMEHFLDSNPGLKSRFNKFIFFRDYTPNELTQIFTLFCQNNGYRSSLPTLDYVKEFFENRCAKKEKNFANAREVRNLFEYAISRQANRVMLIANPTQENLTLLKRADISGENVDLGKQQYMAQLVMDELTKEKCHGMELECLKINIDELELSAGVEEILSGSKITNIKALVDYIDAGNELLDLSGMNEEAEKELLNNIEKLGFEK